MAMYSSDVLRFSLEALRGYPTRSVLMLTAMSIGVAAVIILTALGEGARRYVSNEFSSLGTNLVIVFPGRSETAGLNPTSMMGETPRDLTIDDAIALSKSRYIRRIAPINVGQAKVSWHGSSREVVILGSNSDLLDIRHWEIERGKFLPKTEMNRATSLAVIGKKIKQELFGANPAIGDWIRIGDRRFRVIGILASEGRSIGVDVQETIIIPIATAQQFFNTSSLFRILVEASQRETILPAKDFVIQTLQERHQGEKDVTVVTQDAVLATFDNILSALTYAVGGIAAISLAVAGILIMNVMLVAVSQRTAEIGLLKAVGASNRQVLILLQAEAILLSMLGALCGLLLGNIANLLIRNAYPDFPAYAPLWASISAIAVALLAGAIFSLLPARRAARLDPVLALSGR